MKEIKQVELYTKWWKFVPMEYADEICPKPPDEILEKVQKARSEKSKERNAQKRARAAAGTAGRGKEGVEAKEAGDHARRISYLF